MDNEAILMRKQMDDTLAGLTDKLGELERQVTGTVKTVQTSVSTVRDTFDIKHQVRRRPWTLLAGATALGVLGGLRFGNRKSASPPRAGDSDAPAGFSAARVPKATASNWLTNVSGAFQPELSELKGIVIGAALGLARDVIARQASKPTDRTLAEPTNGRSNTSGGQPPGDAGSA